MEPPRFTRFAAIDWSGARGSRHPGIAVAVAASGGAAPRLVAPPHPRGWSRGEVLEWIAARAAEPMLIGMDFSFAPPFADRGAYLPGTPAPATARALWAWVDVACADADLGAARFPDAHPAHFYRGAASGAKAPFQRWRACEAAFTAGGGGKASSVFDCVGAAQVAKASFAGMRLLNALGGRVPVWPFERPLAAGAVLVEIYCRAFLRLAGGSGRKLRDAGSLAVALAAFGSEAPPGERFTDHETDVLLSAAALRALAHDPSRWSPAGLTPAIAATEGWTFGIA